MSSSKIFLYPKEVLTEDVARNWLNTIINELTCDTKFSISNIELTKYTYLQGIAEICFRNLSNKG